MAVEIHVPELGESVTDATVGKWLKSEGEPVEAGEALVELETDKINFEVEAEEGGVLESISKGEGETVNVGEVIGTIGEGDGSAPQPEPEQEEAEEEPQEAEEAPQPQAQESAGEETNGHREDGGGRASPSVRKLAQEYDVDLAEVSGSGSGGRITRDDVERLIREQGGGGTQTQAPAQAPEPNGQRQEQPAQPAPASEDGRGDLEERVKLTRRRQTIAKRLVEAQQTAAMLTTFNEVDMSAVMELRSRRKDAFQERNGVKLGFMSFFTKASIGALKAFPKINSELQGDELIMKRYYDIGVAVNTEQGLVVPVVRDADRKSFAGIEETISELGRKARDGKLGLEDLRGGTFTITNGGIFGSLNSTPILNTPQVAILGMHKIQERPVAVDGKVEIRPMMYLALSYDHRIVDGADAVSFLVRIKELIEDPESLLLEG
ncbi:2-oxoglutarate dehydrogenase complex dihydrolipoyllysine-residue succinyltransferase [Rubrobacter marinus]|uniref:Dihydrolipoyllysine-residue succinyltransferase component of 2-oxoglutarate dehydrogenase complex n=1 Tax=Rubrobacter marinus TaxID=2653852 RepID=A0A6G8Q0Y9_9ACTN|nr:2-oxoglutarate dehydrogenase complex dihydrolipoyllysine-residue succinyltransferase [Rubrobacter marinus]QIN80159.1 2-oxoglutarate dehydrogenase complex dihydrolipoyllysine-residue succinyltransferase [Rubrobacter marinus]